MKYIIVVFFFLFSNLFSLELETNKIDSVSFYIKKANISTYRNNFISSLQNAQKAIDIAEFKDNKNAKSRANATMGYIYYKINKYDEAIKSLQISINNFDTSNGLESEGSVYYLIGMCYMKINKSAIAESFFQKAEIIYRTTKNPEIIELLKLQKAIILQAKELNNQASDLYNQIINNAEEDKYSETKSEALFQLGAIEQSQNRNVLALNYLEKALEMNSKNEDLNQKSKILFAISNIYDFLGDKSKSYFYLREHLKTKDKLFGLTNEKQEYTDYYRFKDEERLKEIQKKEKELALKIKDSRIAKLVSILAIAIISVLSLLSLSLFKNNIVRNRTNNLLKEKNNELIIAKNNAEKAMQARSDFLSTVSHELRTPLNAINGITHLLLTENPKLSQLEYLQSLKFSGNYLTTFINEILEINRLESHKVVAEKLDFNLKELITNLQTSLKEIATSNNNKYLFEIDSAIPNQIIGDPTKLSQILINLINNALKFTKNGFVQTNIKLKLIENNTVKILFEVIDSGIGIPLEKQESIFDNFSQGSIEINRKFGGTGLGLSIVKNLVEILGGQIQLESEVQKGSTFWFELKFEISKEQTIGVKKIFVNDLLLENKKILLVEDNKINQMVTKKMLENKKVICTITENGEDAIDLLKKNKYDLVLMDVHLPGINGTIATQNIRVFDEMTPIIALTAISLNENRAILLSFGMNDVLTKPFDPDLFYDTISKNLMQNSVL